MQYSMNIRYKVKMPRFSRFSCFGTPWWETFQWILNNGGDDPERHVALDRLHIAPTRNIPVPLLCPLSGITPTRHLNDGEQLCLSQACSLNLHSPKLNNITVISSFRDSQNAKCISIQNQQYNKLNKQDGASLYENTLQPREAEIHYSK